MHFHVHEQQPSTRQRKSSISAFLSGAATSTVLSGGASDQEVKRNDLKKTSSTFSDEEIQRFRKHNLGEFRQVGHGQIPSVDFSFEQRKFSIRGRAGIDDLRGLTFLRAEKWLNAFFEYYRGDLEFVFELELIVSSASVCLMHMVLVLARSNCESLFVRWKVRRGSHNIEAFGRGLRDLFLKEAKNKSFTFLIEYKE